MIYELEDTNRVAALFAGWQDTMIWSCLQKVMGRVYVDSLEEPHSAMAMLGDFCFLAGRPVREVACYKPEWCRQDFMIMVPENEEWEKLLLECYGEKAKKVTRYAVKKERDVFDRDRLKRLAEALPEGFSLKIIDEELYSRCMETDWCRDFVALYPDYAHYREHGLGVVVWKDGEIVSGASSYSGYLGGIEIEIDTREDFRRRGLARACGARLILECLERDWYPSWDAQNPWSLALAKQLGYHFDHTYTAYEIWGY